MDEIKTLIKVYKNVETGHIDFSMANLTTSENFECANTFLRILDRLKIDLKAKTDSDMVRAENVLGKLGPKIKSLPPDEQILMMRDVEAKINEFIRGLESLINGG